MEILPETCRICLRVEKNVSKKERWFAVSLNESDYDHIKFGEKYYRITGIKLSPMPIVAQKICGKCLRMVRKMYSFQQKCLRANETLKKHSEQNQLKNTRNKEEKNLGNNEVKTEYIKEEEDTHSDYNDLEIIYEEKFTLAEFPSTIKKEEALEEDYSNNIKPDNKPKSTAKDKSRGPSNSKKRSDNDKPFMCEICGNLFQRRYLLDKHVREHLGLQKFDCEICGKTFAQQQYLTTHMLRHTGIKQYGCSFCSRRFFTRGKLNEHEKVHKGESQHRCKYCDKIFPYSHSLKRHVLCHLGVKPYFCNYCQKSFRTKSNLDQHFITDIHKDISTRIYSVMNEGLTGLINDHR